MDSSNNTNADTIEDTPSWMNRKKEVIGDQQQKKKQSKTIQYYSDAVFSCIGMKDMIVNVTIPMDGSLSVSISNITTS